MSPWSSLLPNPPRPASKISSFVTCPVPLLFVLALTEPFASLPLAFALSAVRSSKSLKRESIGLSSPMASAARIWSPMARMDSMAPGGEDVLYDLVYGAGSHPHDEAGDAVEPLQRLLRPGHVLLGGEDVRGLVLVVGYENVCRQVAHHVLGVAADVHLLVGVVADAAHHHECRVHLVYVLESLLERLAGQQRRFQFYTLVGGDLLGDL